MNLLRITSTEGVVEAAYEYCGRTWDGIGADANEAVETLLLAMAIDFDTAASAPLGFDVEQFLAQSAGHCDALTDECERLNDRVEELEVLNELMALQYRDTVTSLHAQREAARDRLASARVRIASLEEQLELHRAVMDAS